MPCESGCQTYPLSNLGSSSFGKEFVCGRRRLELHWTSNGSNGSKTTRSARVQHGANPFSLYMGIILAFATVMKK